MVKTMTTVSIFIRVCLKMGDVPHKQNNIHMENGGKPLGLVVPDHKMFTCKNRQLETNWWAWGGHVCFRHCQDFKVLRCWQLKNSHATQLVVDPTRLPLNSHCVIPLYRWFHIAMSFVDATCDPDKYQLISQKVSNTDTIMPLSFGDS